MKKLDSVWIHNIIMVMVGIFSVYHIIQTENSIITILASLNVVLVILYFINVIFKLDSHSLGGD